MFKVKEHIDQINVNLLPCIMKRHTSDKQFILSRRTSDNRFLYFRSFFQFFSFFSFFMGFLTNAQYRKHVFVKSLLNNSSKHDTAVIIVFFAELFGVKHNRDPLNNFFAGSW